MKSSEFPKEPMMLLTNMKPKNEEFTKLINKVYISRCKIEEYYKFKKQQFKFEKILLRTMNMLLSIVIGFIGIFSDNQQLVQYKVIFKTSKSLRKNDEIVLVYYAIEKRIK